MRNNLILLFLLFKSNFLFSQEEDIWIQFKDQKTYLIGYKDWKGEVKIKPKFASITSAKIFKNIIPVFEEVRGGSSKIKQYYLLKNGKQIGEDSLYVSDNKLDCENENKIRFRDNKTDKIGFFDDSGKIVIPAIYDDAKPFYNGFSVVITDGKKMCWKDNRVLSKENPCEKWRWKGNIKIINDKNEVLAENISFEKLNAIDWFSVKKNSNQTDEKYIDFKSPNGDVYSFLNYQKEFKNWFCDQFLSDISLTSLMSFLSDEIYFDVNEILEDESDIRHKNASWKHEKKGKFLEDHKEYFLKVITLFKNHNIEIYEGTSPMLFRYHNKPEYFSDCGEYQNIKFPYFKVYLIDKNQVIKSLGFIKTDNKFKLLEIH